MDVSVRNRLPSIVSYHFRDSSLLVGLTVLLFGALVATVRYQMRPYFVSKIQERVRDQVSGKTQSIVQNLIQDNLVAATEAVNETTFLPEASSKKIIPIGQDPSWNCIGNRLTYEWGEICEGSKALSFIFPLKTADNRLGRIEIIMPASIEDWPPYRHLMHAVAASLIFILAVACILMLNFRRRIALPVDRTLSELEIASDKDDFENILTRLPCREMYTLTSRLSSRSAELMEAKHKAELGEISSQVFHDIQSPLKVISAFAENPPVGIEKEQLRLLRGSARRIEDMTYQLLEDHYQKRNENYFTFLSRPVLSIFKEKEFLLRSNKGIKLELKLPEDVHLFAVGIGACELQRVLSNVVNNSIEALEGRTEGRITISMDRIKDTSSLARIVIEDNGCGMSPELLQKIRQQIPAVTNKANGHGMGLSNANKVMQKIGGILILESEEGVGTKVIFGIPLLPTPKWLSSPLKFHDQQKVVVVEDDECVHEVYRKSFPRVAFTFVTRPKDFSLERFPTEAWTYIFDYDLGPNEMTGLDLIEHYKLQKHAVLVTGSFENLALQKRVEQSGAKMLPKFSLAPETTSTCEMSIGERESPEIVFFNDEDFVNDFWNLRAQETGKKLLIVTDENAVPDELIARRVPIYIHKTLKGVKSGLDVAKSLYSRGFREIFLATGDPTISASDWPFIKGVVDKSFPTI